MTEKKEVIQLAHKVGECFQINMWEDRTKGHVWVPTYDNAALRFLNDDYVRTRNIRVTDSGMHNFEFVPLAAGVFTISFELRYGWKFSADNHVSYELTVTA